MKKKKALLHILVMWQRSWTILRERNIAENCSKDGLQVKTILAIKEINRIMSPVADFVECCGRGIFGK
jgi:hypothetical protein